MQPPEENDWIALTNDPLPNGEAVPPDTATLREIADKTSRWAMRGLIVDWQDYDRVYTAAGLIPPKDHRPVHEDWMVYDADRSRVGYATSIMYSPVLQQLGLEPQHYFIVSLHREENVDNPAHLRSLVAVLEAADIVLTDDDFAEIRALVEEHERRTGSTVATVV